MKHVLIRQRFILASVLLSAGLAAGCTTVVTPLSTSDSMSIDGSHGLLVGHIRFARHGPEQPEERKRPVDMKWSLEEETQGTHIVLADLPTDGPFMVKLPVGSYRVKGISVNGIWGTWHTVLPSTFLVQSGGCTSLGTLELQRKPDSFADRLNYRARLQGARSDNVEPQQVLETRTCATVAESSVRSTSGFENGLGGYEF